MLDLIDNKKLEVRQARYERKLAEMKLTKSHVAEVAAKSNAQELAKLRQSPAYKLLAIRLGVK